MIHALLLSFAALVRPPAPPPAAVPAPPAASAPAPAPAPPAEEVEGCGGE